MRLSRALILIPVLAVLAMACGPRRPCMSHHGEPCKGGRHAMAMPHGCGPESCTYKSHCFSSGAVRSNDGVCQACSAGKWVSASGCSEHGKCGDCDYRGKGKGGKGHKSEPCHHKPHGH